MTFPFIKTYTVNPKEIALCWKASPKSSIRMWNLYGSSVVPISINDSKGVDISGFNLIRENIPNAESSVSPGSVFISLTREELELNPEDSFYFVITSIDENGVESVLDKKYLHAVPSDDDYFVDEAGEPTNIVYKNFEFTMVATEDWDSDRFLDMVSLLGRNAKQLRIVSKNSDIQIKINSFTGDAITIDASEEYPYILSRGELQIKKVWFHKSGEGSTAVRMFVAG